MAFQFSWISNILAKTNGFFLTILKWNEPKREKNNNQQSTTNGIKTRIWRIPFTSFGIIGIVFASYFVCLENEIKNILIQIPQKYASISKFHCKTRLTYEFHKSMIHASCACGVFFLSSRSIHINAKLA